MLEAIPRGQVVSVHPLLFERLEPGTRVRAESDVLYRIAPVRHDDDMASRGFVAAGSLGTVVQPLGFGLSVIRWDCAPDRELTTSNDSLALVPS